jgi:tetratricopeptide (TPR) repeat protein
LLAEAIDLYYSRNYILAKARLKELFAKYRKNMNKKYIFGQAYYLMGLINDKLSEKEEALKNFKNGCFFPLNFPEKTASCLSAELIAYQLNLIPEAESIENKIKGKITKWKNEAEFLRSIKYFLKKDYKTTEKILDRLYCDRLNVSFIEYCHYEKGVSKFMLNKYNTALTHLKKVKSPDYRKEADILRGFIYLKLGKTKYAEMEFKKYLERYGSAGKYSTLAYYGLALVNLNKGSLKEVLRLAGILESRDKELAQNLYLKLADIYRKKGNFQKAMVLYQVALKLTQNYKLPIKKKLIIVAYNNQKYDYVYKLSKGVNEPIFNLIRGYSEYWLGMYNNAAKDLEKAVNGIWNKKDKLTALQVLADIYYRTNRDKKYLDTVKRIKEFDKKLARDLLGWFFFKKKKYDKAYKAFVDPYMKAVSLFNMNRLDDALRLIKNNPTKKAKLLEAYIYLKKGDYNKARELLRKLAKFGDKVGEQAAYLYAFSFFAEGDYPRAVEELTKFLQRSRDPQLRKIATLRLADSYYNIGNKEVARRIYEEFIRKHADSPEAIDAAYQLTVLEMNSSDADVERQILKFVRKYPNYPMADLLKLQLADLYIEKKRYSDAEKILNEVIKRNRKESEYALYKLAYVKYLEGDIDGAIRLAKRYVAKYPNGKYRTAALELLAKIYEERGDLRNAAIYVEKLPKTSKNIFRLANLYFDLGEYGRAEELYKELYNKYPEYRPDLAYYLGIIALEKGNLDEAELYFNEALNGSDYDRVAGAYYYLGMIALKKGKQNEALNNFLNVIYLYSNNKIFVNKARLRAAEIMKKQERLLEASCMLKKVNTKYLDKNERDLYNRLKKSLPKCYE